MSASPPPPTATVVPVGAISPVDREQMLALLETTYEHVDPQRFARDLEAQHDVIVLRDAEGTVQGFWSLRRVRAEVGRRSLRGVCTGDPVTARAFRGQPQLGRALRRYLVRLRARRPWAPLYWVLLTRGHDTYLSMASDFTEHYPRFEHETPPPTQQVMAAFGEELCGASFERGSGLERCGDATGELRPGVADVTANLIATNPRVAFFAARNPGWAEGDALLCLARMRWTMPLAWAWRSARARATGGAPGR